MTQSDVVFSRIILGSGVALALLGLAYFRLFGKRAKAAVATVVLKSLPIVSVAFVGVALAFDLPLVAKVLLWIPAAVIAFAVLFGQLFARRIKSALKTKPKT